MIIPCSGACVNSPSVFRALFSFACSRSSERMFSATAAELQTYTWQCAIKYTFCCGRAERKFSPRKKSAHAISPPLSKCPQPFLFFTLRNSPVSARKTHNVQIAIKWKLLEGDIQTKKALYTTAAAAVSNIFLGKPQRELFLCAAENFRAAMMAAEGECDTLS